MPRKKDPNKMICTSIQLPPDVLRVLRDISDGTGVTVSELIRRAIAGYMGGHLDDLRRYCGNGK